jgi:epoxyqueuosine reductase
MARQVDKERLRARLLELGFDEARFARADRVPVGQFADWLQRGWHADMNWLPASAAKRQDLQLVLPEATTMIMLGVNYWPGPSSPAAQQQRWAKYALYSDYHDTMLAGLKAAGAVLEREAGLGSTDYRYYVDSGPVLERGWAALSGLGFQGKNGMLISRQHGNWLLLAAIAARLDVEPDEPISLARRTPERDPQVGLLCGKCVRCIEACPTAAIREPGLVDARLCISYQTIENKGIIPRELRASFGGRIFGCDICLDVCPWNRFAQAGRRSLLVSREEIAGLSLREILEMTPERFREVFRKSPIKRTKLAGLQRNACIAAGNLPNVDWTDTIEQVLPSLRRLAGQAEPIVRAHAVWALRQLVGVEGQAELEAMAAAEPDPLVLEEYRAEP